ncbi:and lysine N-methyltransferase EFM7 [Seminavis robusta]|uniref:And lysine N-methyltransferase EFM7 n=1 Tax=Seminavis robusta TaxID=568900 RepID=A0A9N8DY45_9STRA|nr:and lysine N-methyltransferase EFM7 [Seminavis robusta]|eukprot:Sro360_g126260.1 and lysine N-methyltransferase EFM7 (340) ;mRNA; r:42479-43498
MSDHAQVVDDDDPLPLSALKHRLSEKTYQWLEAAEFPTEDDEGLHFVGFSLSSANDDEDEEQWTRVQDWCSSASTPDGVGGYYNQEELGAPKDGGIKVQYILSSASGGHGDDLWAASRHVANLLADKDQCRKLLGASQTEGHPLAGRSFLELGAGGGVPSWTAQWCGARVVVCTDQSIPDRIRCLAECAERNGRRIQQQQLPKQKETARVAPYDWGSSIDEVVSFLTPEENSKTMDNNRSLFDVIVAADCIYMPELHTKLIDSLRRLLHPQRGVALLPFALHGNTDDTRVWTIIETAQEFGFKVENLGSVQLTPQADGMDAKRALVHMLRLTVQQQQRS